MKLTWSDAGHRNPAVLRKQNGTMLFRVCEAICCLVNIGISPPRILGRGIANSFQRELLASPLLQARLLSRLFHYLHTQRENIEH